MEKLAHILSQGLPRGMIFELKEFIKSKFDFFCIICDLID